MIANIIVIGCTVLMVGAVIWVVIAEHNSPDSDTSDTENIDANEDKKED